MKALLQRYGVDPYIAAVALAVLFVCAVAVVFFQLRSSAEARAEREALTTEMEFMRERLTTAEAENEQLRSLLQSEASENEEFSRRVEELTNTVGYLDKLSKTDRELLQKYSSVYFLSENFTPDPLTPLSDEFLARNESNQMIHGDVRPFLENMMNAAKQDGKPLLILSAYRSFGEQSALKSSYKVSYGSGANKFSADQGYSEHQLGSTVDFTTPENPESLTTNFRNTPQFSWLIAHAHEYGFILSYPEGNSYFQFEPWHWRFVGKALANRMYQQNEYFYDLDQREINAYLSRIFD